MTDPYDLERFVDAQTQVYATVVEELRAGHKQSHWMWYIFPQLRGLGRSAMASHYGIASKAEANAYLQHPLLGSRLRQCTALMLAHDGRTLGEILGVPDDRKFVSCMTLFAEVSGEEGFAQALACFAGGRADPATLDLLA